MTRRAKLSTSLPTEVSASDLCTLLDFSVQHLAQLQRDGVVEKTARDRYPLSSITKIVQHMRSRGSGPREWQNARTKYALEKTKIVTFERQRLEGESLPANEVRAAMTAAIAVMQTYVLGIPTKLVAGLGPTLPPILRERLPSMQRENVGRR